VVNCCGPASKYNARHLREPVTFERVTETVDAYGARLRAWGPIAGAPSRAMVRPLSGGERYASARTEATSTHRVVVRYFEGLTERDRVVIRARPYNIRFIANVDMADRWLEISVELGASV
jgi:SPP1 family predicted phage head-tail adaptor